MIFGLDLYFSEVTKTLSLSRGEDGIFAAPFYNSFHKLDMYVETLSWKLGESFINLSASKGTKNIKSAQFSSLNFFDVKSYDNLNTDRGNILVSIKRYVNICGSKTFTIDDLAKYLVKSLNDLQFMLFNLTEKGFINYDSEKK